ncbi:DUF188 domain-containing protein, partial [Staphylococcus epidermidis]
MVITEDYGVASLVIDKVDRVMDDKGNIYE